MLPCGDLMCRREMSHDEQSFDLRIPEYIGGKAARSLSG